MKAAQWWGALLLLSSMQVHAQIPTPVPLPGGISPSDVCALKDVPVTNGQYTPFTKTQRMRLYLRCEATFQLFPGVPLQQGQQCCDHLQPPDGAGLFCPDTPAGGLIKTYVHSDLFPC